MPKAKYNRDTELFEVTCIHESLNVYELSDYDPDDKRIVIERVYDGGGTIPHSELFCCGEMENVFHWRPRFSEMGYYVLDRVAAMIRLACPPAGPLLVKMHFIPISVREEPRLEFFNHIKEKS